MKLFIGTSGWLYKDWGDKFYPKGSKETDKLVYFSQHFKTVEINSTFYRMPQADTFKRWNKVVSQDFTYTVKFSKFLTRTKRLMLDKDSKPYASEFLKRTAKLKDHLGAILFQLPPNFKCNNERLQSFMEFLYSYLKQIKLKTDVAFEFRHATWFNEETYSILRRFKTAFVIGNSSVYPSEKVFTTNFSYMRMHGPGSLFSSNYSDRQLKEYADFISAHSDLERFYVYFNNDFHEYTLDNANTLREYLEDNAN